MSRDSIDELDVMLPEDTTPKKVGMRYENKTVHLYLLDDDDAVRPTSPDILLTFIKAMRDTYYADVPLSAFNWHLRAGFTESTVTFDDRSGTSLQMNVSNGLICHSPPAALNDYRSNKFNELNPPLQRKMDPPQKKETYYTQNTPDGKTFLFTPAGSASPENTDVVYVDSQKFLKLMAKHSPEQLLRPDELQHRKHSGFMGDWTRLPQSLLKISCIPTSKGLAFGIAQGSADLLAAIQDSGTDKFPVAVDKEQAALLRQLCGPSENGRSPPHHPGFGAPKKHHP